VFRSLANGESRYVQSVNGGGTESGGQAGRGSGGKATAYGRQQQLWRDRLSKNAGHPDIVEAHVRAGDDDDGNVSRAGVRRDFLLHRDAAERRQDQVEDHEICGSLFEDVEREAGATLVSLGYPLA